MARPARPQWTPRAYARRRHRTWILSMTLATLGWCAFWTHVALAHVAPGAAPPPALTRAAMAACALLGLAGAVLSLRAKRAWILLGLVAILANASLLALPWLAL